MTGDNPQSFDISLDFLDAEQRYKVTIYRDDKNGKPSVIREEKLLTKTDFVTIDLAKAGGSVLVLEPYTQKME